MTNDNTIHAVRCLNEEELSQVVGGDWVDTISAAINSIINLLQSLESVIAAIGALGSALTSNLLTYFGLDDEGNDNTSNIVNAELNYYNYTGGLYVIGPNSSDVFGAMAYSPAGGG